MKQVFITTSWDDGSRHDLRLAELLRKYNLPATFYVSKEYRDDRLADAEIVNLSKNFEIGAHTLTHPNLDLITEERAKFEIKESKKWLENLIESDIEMFAYPRGRFKAATKNIIEDAGFVGARTVEEFKFDFSFDPFEMPTSLRVAPYPWRRKSGGAISFSGGILGFQPKRYIKSLSLGLQPKSYLGFANLAKGLFDKIYQNGGIFHLWGHSWEIENLNMWQDLESVFKYISGRPGIKYRTNKEIIKKM